MTEDFFDPIYKGCTSPSTVFGVPMLTFILGTLVFAQISVIGFFVSGMPVVVVMAILYGFSLAWARRISRNDEQRLPQLILRMRMRGPQRASIRYWGAVTFAPTKYRK